MSVSGESMEPRMEAWNEKDRIWKTRNNQEPILKYCADNSLKLHAVQKKLIEVTEKHESAIFLGSADELQFLANLCRVINAKKTLDIGTFTGYSALSIALALPEDGHVVTCDCMEENVNIGKPFWKEAAVEHKIDSRIGNAEDILRSLLENGEAGTYDFAFIDADKEPSEIYYELCLQLIRPKGIIAIDNTLWRGRVFNPEIQDAVTVALRNIVKHVHADERVDTSMLFIGDGTTLAFKK